MGAWIELGAAIVLEVAGTTALRLSQGFTRWLWVGAFTLTYAASFYLFARSLRVIPLGVSYAVWSGVGTVLTAGIGYVLFAESFSPVQLAGIALVVGGVLLLNLGAVR
ncbi:MAG: DMT family transporter [Actinomycetes bacterium]